MDSIKKKKLKYESKDTTDLIFKQIKLKSEKYFFTQKSGKNANAFLWFKLLSMLTLAAAAYYGIVYVSTFLLLILCYIVLFVSLLIVGLNIGHDAAHHCVTGNKKTDNFIIQFIFAINGMSGYFWQVKHNHLHHIYPNVYNHDSELEITSFFLLDPKQKSHKIHKYQHIYASFLYLTFSLLWLFYVDFAYFFDKNRFEFNNRKTPIIEFTKVIFIKFFYFINFIVLPAHLCSDVFSLTQIIGAFVIAHLFVSLGLSYLSYVSHHVEEVDYVQADESAGLINDTWTKHQIITTIDFNPDSRVANFIFGGFNLHVAHHLFPDTCHVHYRALTAIIKETLEENKVDWYKSFTFFEGISSHLKHLKNSADVILTQHSIQQNND